MAGVAAQNTLLSEAADWLIVLRYEAPSAKEQASFEQWRSQSPAHEAAWHKAESMLGVFAQVPPEICQQTLRSVQRPDRRKSLAMLGACWWQPQQGGWHGESCSGAIGRPTRPRQWDNRAPCCCPMAPP